jgi:hypothetical protein
MHDAVMAEFGDSHADVTVETDPSPDTVAFPDIDMSSVMTDDSTPLV